MSPSGTPQVTPLQLDILRVLWRSGEATANEVREALRPGRRLAPTTVATVLRRMEAGGLVAHETRGRAHVFRALREEPELAREQVTEVAERVFGGDLPELFAQLLRSHDVAPDDLARIRELIEAKERELGGG